MMRRMTKKELQRFKGDIHHDIQELRTEVQEGLERTNSKIDNLSNALFGRCKT